MYAITQLFKKFKDKNIKILLPFAEESLKGRSDSLQKTLNILGKSFKEIVDDIGRASCLVITKQNDFLDTQEVIDRLKQTLLDNHIHISAEARSLLNVLQNPDQIAFLPAPTKKGDFFTPNTPERRDFTTSILTALSHAQPIQNISPTLMISDRTIVFVEQLAQGLCDTTSHFLSFDITFKVYNHCLEKITDEVNLQTLRAYFNGLVQDLTHIKTDDINVFKKGLRVVLRKCAMHSEYDQLKRQIGYLSFLQESNAKISYPLQAMAWFTSFLLPIKNNIEKLAMPPQVSYRNQDNSLLIQGFLVGTSDVVPALNGRQQPAMVHLHGIHTLWIDQDIESHGTFGNPGISFSFIAPLWKVIGNRTINLRGVDGTNGINGISPGSHGAPGNAGGNGCSFYGKGERFDNMNAFAVCTDGGHGGNGGNGVNGAAGKDGIDGSTVITSNVENVFPWRIKGGGAYWWEEAGIRKYYNNPGTNGEPGRRGGQGGAAGRGGRAGIALIDGYPAWNHVGQDGQDGNAGICGQGGIGGAHGRHCQGQVLDTWFHAEGRYDGGSLRVHESYGARRHDRIEIPIALAPSRGRGPNGEPGGTGVNISNQQIPLQLMPLNPASLREIYNGYGSSQDTHFLENGNHF